MARHRCTRGPIHARYPSAAPRETTLTPAIAKTGRQFLFLRGMMPSDAFVASRDTGDGVFAASPRFVFGFVSAVMAPLVSPLGAATVASNPTSLDGVLPCELADASRFGSAAIGPAFAARSASRISLALFHRSALSNESALSITLAIGAGRSGARLVTDRAFFVAAATSSCDAFAPSWTFSP